LDTHEPHDVIEADGAKFSGKATDVIAAILKAYGQKGACDLYRGVYTDGFAGLAAILCWSPLK